ncbi:uncharacterized protein LOC129754711 isoform X1 [Uranotaenia lowii]|uniref:uncharacterized protein LOC129754711 isoform X1 n=1 Tax=Uranotaenia lowii TaxID=190385 RepID=UPI002478F2BD|nr:uncharacterized protein LOC129754711 isoform X1 [Uranotaenia lowii]
MGCASSSPLINGGGPGGIVETVKETANKTATEVLHAGETAIHGVGEQVKEAVQNVTHEIEGVLGKKSTKDGSDSNDDGHPQINGHDKDGTDYQIIPLKDNSSSGVDENLENIKNNILKKAQSFGEDADKMADDIMKETEDLIRDAETGIVDCASEMTTRITSSEDGTIEILNLEGNETSTPTHSIDSLKTSSPEPEIERILDNEPNCPPTPEATMNSLMEVAPETKSEPSSAESETVASAAEQQQQQEHDESKREA